MPPVRGSVAGPDSPGSAEAADGHPPATTPLHSTREGRLEVEPNSSSHVGSETAVTERPLLWKQHSPEAIPSFLNRPRPTPNSHITPCGAIQKKTRTLRREENRSPSGAIKKLASGPAGFGGKNVTRSRTWRRAGQRADCQLQGCKCSCIVPSSRVWKWQSCHPSAIGWGSDRRSRCNSWN